MELIVNIEDRRVYRSFVQFLKSLRFAVLSEKTSKQKKPKADAISLLSEKSLADEWNSQEDDQWDKVL